MEEETKAKIATYARAAAENKHKKIPETDAYNILPEKIEPEKPKPIFKDIGYDSEPATRGEELRMLGSSQLAASKALRIRLEKYFDESPPFQFFSFFAFRNDSIASRLYVSSASKAHCEYCEAPRNAQTMVGFVKP